MQERERFLPPPRVILPLPEGLIPDQTGYTIVGLNKSENVVVFPRSETLLEIEFPEIQSDRSIAITVVGRTHSGGLNASTYLLTYSRSGGWKTQTNGVALRWKS